MSRFFVYLLETSVCLVGFWLLYRFLFRNLTHYRLNRFVLLSMLIAGLLIPAISTQLPGSLQEEWWEIRSSFLAGGNLNIAGDDVTEDDVATPGLQPYPFMEEVVPDGVVPEVRVVETSSVVGMVILIFYLTGVVGFTMKYIMDMLRLVRVIRKHNASSQGAFKVIRLERSTGSFSFFRYLFIAGKGLSKQSENLVLRHEIAHAVQLHSLDMLLIRLAGIVFWFNPVLIGFRRDLQDVHEHLADEAALERTDALTYSKLILSLATTDRQALPVQNFSYKKIKKRITMIGKTKSSVFSLARYAMILPILAAFVLAFPAGRFLLSL